MSNTLTGFLAIALCGAPGLNAQQRDTLERPNPIELTIGAAAGSAVGGLTALLLTAAACAECRDSLSDNEVPYYIGTTLGAAAGARLLQQNHVPSTRRALLGAVLGVPLGVVLGAVSDRASNSVAWVGYIVGQGIVTGLVSSLGRPK